MRIIFCSSYLSVPRTISIVESSEEDFLVVVSHPAMRRFFARLYPPENIFDLQPRSLRSGNPFQLLWNIMIVLQSKKEVWQKFQAYKDAKVYTFSMAFCEFECWLVKRLAARNTIFYKPAVDIGALEPDRSISGRFNAWLKKRIYSVSFLPVIGPECTMCTVSEAHLREIGARDFSIECDVAAVGRRIMAGLEGLQNAKVLILCGGTAGAECDEEEYIKKMDALIGMLIEKYGHNALAIKAHPRLPDCHSKEKTLTKIPEDIPANLILGHFDVVIGYATAALTEAANAGVKSISLLRYIRPKNADTQRYYIEYLNRNAESPIYYPETLNDMPMDF